jgi:hypothetical protein
MGVPGVKSGPEVRGTPGAASPYFCVTPPSGLAANPPAAIGSPTPYRSGLVAILVAHGDMFKQAMNGPNPCMGYICNPSTSEIAGGVLCSINSGYEIVDSNGNAVWTVTGVFAPLVPHSSPHP